MNKQRFVEIYVEKRAADTSKPGALSRVGSGLKSVGSKALGLLPAGIIAYLGLKGAARGATEAIRTPETEEGKRADEQEHKTEPETEFRDQRRQSIGQDFMEYNPSDSFTPKPCHLSEFHHSDIHRKGPGQAVHPS